MPEMAAQKGIAMVVFLMMVHFNVSLFGTTLQGAIFPDNIRMVYANQQDCIDDIPAVRTRYEGNRIQPSKITCEAFTVKGR
jgi:hypothetical protein